MLPYYKRLLLDLFRRVHRVQLDPVGLSAEVVAIQEILVRRISYIESRQKALRRHGQVLRRSLRNPKGLRLSREVVSGTRQAIRDIGRKIDDYRHIEWILRSIGDALAFIYVDKWDIKPMAGKEPTGFVIDDPGFRHQLRLWRRFVSLGRIAILTDLTNSLRYGDLLLVSPEHRWCQLIEIKSSHTTNARVRRQMERVQQLLEYLRTDRTRDLYQTPQFAGCDMIRIDVPRPEVTHCASMRNLVSRAYESDLEWEQVESGLLYAAMTRKGISKMDLLRNEIGSEALAFWIDPRSRIAGYQPLVLSIPDPEFLYDFYSGGIALVVACDLAVIGNKLSSLGWKWSFQPNDQLMFRLEETCPQDPSQPMTVSISATLLYRVAIEFTSLDWILDAITEQTRVHFAGTPDSSD